MLIEGFLTRARLDELNELLGKIPFEPGQSTGGMAGALIKNNLQADARHAEYVNANALVVQTMFSTPALYSWAQVSKVTPVRFARYGAGMAYGDHVDAAVHPLSNMVVRTDISFTIFLSGPEDYEGGELVLNVLGVDQVIKGNAGDIVLYPTGITHRVNAVRSGWRKVAIGWIQSLVPNHEHRDILYKLLRARDSLLATTGRSLEFELVNDSYENLLRLFVQP